jgi:uncharacterized phage-associated protein
MAVRFTIDWEKSLAALVYLSSKGLPEFDKYKACKLIFLADKYHLVQHARPITGDFYFAVAYGPIPTVILDRIKKFESGEDAELASVLEQDKRFANPHFRAKVETNFSALSQSDIIALDKIAELFGQKNFAELKAITHAMPAYSKAWDSRLEGTKRAEMSFEDFFEEDSEAVQGALEEMIEQYSLESVFPARVL